MSQPPASTPSAEPGGRTALVTGGGVGIGAGIAIALAQAGVDVAITHHSHDGADVVAQIGATGRRGYDFALDATDSAAVDRVVGEAAAALGGHIDILVNNSGGLVARKPLAELTDEHWHTVLDLNLSSAFYCIRSVLAFMGDGGRIVNISSVAGSNGGGPGALAYATSKAGMDGLTRAAAKELAPRGIAVNGIAPGLILDTPFHDAFTPVADQQATVRATPVGRAGYPTDVAAAAVFLSSPGAGFTTGVTINNNGGTYFS
ncbi:MAG TPA: SDR family NAD(P)-dependent oxidoreductase [Actinopolymorphaceae bacterium]|jgi:3-oxoacyl-[acyl-carrier protein] reductase